ncbi:related to app1-actin patch protein [Ceraceosorus bombacis]|uniref:Related to app1-actin patch protein n=1 Tax=Ceraceosorus bombacis TaxID=401625 RepID=A0A0P1B9N1_9BASI|nr:related to app1-actin patch protein [Ceraceosorus bombacis]
MTSRASGSTLDTSQSGDATRSASPASMSNSNSTRATNSTRASDQACMRSSTSRTGLHIRAKTSEALHLVSHREWAELKQGAKSKARAAAQGIASRSAPLRSDSALFSPAPAPAPAPHPSALASSRSFSSLSSSNTATATVTATATAAAATRPALPRAGHIQPVLLPTYAQLLPARDRQPQTWSCRDAPEDLSDGEVEIFLRIRGFVERWPESRSTAQRVWERAGRQLAGLPRLPPRTSASSHADSSASLLSLNSTDVDDAAFWPQVPDGISSDTSGQRIGSTSQDRLPEKLADTVLEGAGDAALERILGSAGVLPVESAPHQRDVQSARRSEMDAPVQERPVIARSASGSAVPLVGGSSTWWGRSLHELHDLAENLEWRLRAFWTYKVAGREVRIEVLPCFARHQDEATTAAAAGWRTHERDAQHEEGKSRVIAATTLVSDAAGMIDDSLIIPKHMIQAYLRSDSRFTIQHNATPDDICALKVRALLMPQKSLAQTVLPSSEQAQGEPVKGPWHTLTVQPMRRGVRRVRLISDVDDTVRHTHVLGGTRAVFRNVFVRNHQEVQVEGVSQWYDAMVRLGVGIHYVSNAPCELHAVVRDYLANAGLPSGQLALKHYPAVTTSSLIASWLQPAAARKRGALTGIMTDFPDDAFILVGDSGEMDLDVYTELAIARPNQVAAILIRDVSTPTSSSVPSSSSHSSLAEGRAPKRSNTMLSSAASTSTTSSSASAASSSTEPDPSTLAWHARLVRASRALPSSVVLQTWREGRDVQSLCEYLVQSLQSSDGQTATAAPAAAAAAQTHRTARDAHSSSDDALFRRAPLKPLGLPEKALELNAAPSVIDRVDGGGTVPAAGSSSGPPELPESSHREARPPPDLNKKLGRPQNYKGNFPGKSKGAEWRRENTERYELLKHRRIIKKEMGLTSSGKSKEDWPPWDGRSAHHHAWLESPQGKEYIRRVNERIAADPATLTDVGGGSRGLSWGTSASAVRRRENPELHAAARRRRLVRMSLGLPSHTSRQQPLPDWDARSTGHKAWLESTVGRLYTQRLRDEERIAAEHPRPKRPPGTPAPIRRPKQLGGQVALPQQVPHAQSSSALGGRNAAEPERPPSDHADETSLLVARTRVPDDSIFGGIEEASPSASSAAGVDRLPAAVKFLRTRPHAMHRLLAADTPGLHQGYANQAGVSKETLGRALSQAWGEHSAARASRAIDVGEGDSKVVAFTQAHAERLKNLSPDQRRKVAALQSYFDSNPRDMHLAMSHTDLRATRRSARKLKVEPATLADALNLRRPIVPVAKTKGRPTARAMRHVGEEEVQTNREAILRALQEGERLGMMPPRNHSGPQRVKNSRTSAHDDRKRLYRALGVEPPRKFGPSNTRLTPEGCRSTQLRDLKRAAQAANGSTECASMMKKQAGQTATSTSATDHTNPLLTHSDHSKHVSSSAKGLQQDLNLLPGQALDDLERQRLAPRGLGTVEEAAASASAKHLESAPIEAVKSNTPASASKVASATTTKPAASHAKRRPHNTEPLAVFKGATGYAQLLRWNKSYTTQGLEVPAHIRLPKNALSKGQYYRWRMKGLSDEEFMAKLEDPKRADMVKTGRSYRKTPMGVQSTQWRDKRRVLAVSGAPQDVNKRLQPGEGSIVSQRLDKELTNLSRKGQIARLFGEDPAAALPSWVPRSYMQRAGLLRGDPSLGGYSRSPTRASANPSEPGHSHTLASLKESSPATHAAPQRRAVASRLDDQEVGRAMLYTRGLSEPGSAAWKETEDSLRKASFSSASDANPSFGKLKKSHSHAPAVDTELRLGFPEQGSVSPPPRAAVPPQDTSKRTRVDTELSLGGSSAKRPAVDMNELVTPRTAHLDAWRQPNGTHKHERPGHVDGAPLYTSLPPKAAYRGAGSYSELLDWNKAYGERRHVPAEIRIHDRAPAKSTVWHYKQRGYTDEQIMGLVDKGFFRGLRGDAVQALTPSGRYDNYARYANATRLKQRRESGQSAQDSQRLRSLDRSHATPAVEQAGDGPAHGRVAPNQLVRRVVHGDGDRSIDDFLAAVMEGHDFRLPHELENLHDSPVRAASPSAWSGTPASQTRHSGVLGEQTPHISAPHALHWDSASPQSADSSVPESSKASSASSHMQTDSLSTSQQTTSSALGRQHKTRKGDSRPRLAMFKGARSYDELYSWNKEYWKHGDEAPVHIRLPRTAPTPPAVYYRAVKKGIPHETLMEGIWSGQLRAQPSGRQRKTPEGNKSTRWKDRQVAIAKLGLVPRRSTFAPGLERKTPEGSGNTARLDKYVTEALQQAAEGTAKLTDVERAALTNFNSVGRPKAARQSLPAHPTAHSPPSTPTDH